MRGESTKKGRQPTTDAPTATNRSMFLTSLFLLSGARSVAFPVPRAGGALAAFTHGGLVAPAVLHPGTAVHAVARALHLLPLLELFGRVRMPFIFSACALRYARICSACACISFISCRLTS